jgi:long-subunit acyl-CoA synthetase (AMP-forming)
MREFFKSLAIRAAADGDALALASPGSTLTYAALFERISREAHWASRLPDKVGCLFGKGADGIVADLALTFAGKLLVPLPDFFSDTQLQYIAHTTQLTDVVTEPAWVDRVRRLGFSAHVPVTDHTSALEPAAEASRLIFTSGTSGQPKGVQLATRQLNASVAALAEVSQAKSSDRYLSLLPYALLLEQIAGIYLPLTVGASIHIYSQPLATTLGEHIAIAAERSQATSTVLVPELLGAWLMELQARNRRAPDALRFIAVGGAPVSTSLASAAWQRGLPVFEGYGLSECCSVVTANSPQLRRAGTVGKPLPGIRVEIDQGEIVVSGPTVMNGYLGGPRLADQWRTGDLGHFDNDGFLVVTGRKDNVVVTAAGRNVSPEWIEQAIIVDPRIGRCVVVEHDGNLVALLVPRDAALCQDIAALGELVTQAVSALPDYARPKRQLAVSEQDLKRLELLTANARPRRREIAQYVAGRCIEKQQAFSLLERA